MRTMSWTFVMSLMTSLASPVAAAEPGTEPGTEPAPVSTHESETPPGMAPAAEATAPDLSGLPSFAVGAELGGTVPFTTLGSQVAVGIELGYLLPVLERRLEVLVGAGWAPPQRSYSEGPYRAEVTQHELHFSLGPRYRFLEVGGPFNFNAALGGRMYLLRSVSAGTSGDQAFPEYREQSTRFGFFLAAGGEYRLGPGRLFLDLDFAWAPLPHRITGEASTANLAPTLGYRLLF
jgi:hypothetical protein